MSSPICARKIFLSAPARTTARAPSPSITTPKRTRSGGGGGGAGGAGACTTGGGGGAGGRRLGENSGRSSIVDSWSRGCAATGVAGAAADCSCSSVLAAVLNAEADKNKRRINAAGGRKYLTAHLAAKTRASLKWSATAGLRRHDPLLRRSAAPPAHPQIRTAFRFQADTAPRATTAGSYQAWPAAGSYQVRRRAWRLLRRTKQGWHVDRRPIARDRIAVARSPGPGSTHRGMPWVAPLRSAELRVRAAWLRDATASRDVRSFPAMHRRAPETTSPPRTRTPEAAEQEPRRKLPARGLVSTYLNPPQP